MSEKKRIDIEINDDVNDGDDGVLSSVLVMPLRGIVVFPNIVSTIELNDEADIEVCELAYKSDQLIFLVSQKKPVEVVLPLRKEYFAVGCAGYITSFEKTENGAKIDFDGKQRAIYVSPEMMLGRVDIKLLDDANTINEGDVKHDVSLYSLKKYFGELSRLIPRFPKDIRDMILGEEDVSYVCDAIAYYGFVSYIHKQQVLQENNVIKRLELMLELIKEELEGLYNEISIHKKVRERIDENQRDYYLREQLKVIKEELGETSDEEDDDITQYVNTINKKKLPEEVKNKLLKEASKLAKTPYSSAESTVIRNYLDVCLEIPFDKKTNDKVNVIKTKAVLDKDHYGLEKVKDRILEFIAVKQLTPDIKNQILCLVGPPGVGKTSIVSSIAKSLGRKYVRVCLGGVKDESDIRGHRKTYVASMPGRIVNALIQAGVSNPVILLDEIDKMSNDFKGDPASAMLEVLDSEQNREFRDHFVEMPIDLSDCIFIATANSLERVARPLIDRMEIINLSSYNRREKFEIAKKHLYPKQLKRHGLTKKQLKLSDAVIYELIDFYTHEAGVRNLERELASLCRKAAKELVLGAEYVSVTDKNLSDYLGQRKIIPDKIYDADEIGVVNGLAYTELGGEMLRVEAVKMPGTGKTSLTGSLGDVMKESAQIAVSYIRTNAKRLGLDPDFYKNEDIHIHFPEGAVPKDGPSAGVALACAITSELGGYPARRDVAMTGEITLHGRVLPIGGLKEKTMAAYKAGIHTVLVPEDNRKDISELDPMVKENINFVFCRTVNEAIDNVLIMPQ